MTEIQTYGGLIMLHSGNHIFLNPTNHSCRWLCLYLSRNMIIRQTRHYGILLKVQWF